MIREIKFRVYLGQKILGYERLTEKGWQWNCPELDPDGGGQRWSSGTMENHGNELERRQFTGFTGKKGVEIYEKDVVSINKAKALITWSDDGFYFSYENEHWLDDWNLVDDSYRMTVVKNDPEFDFL